MININKSVDTYILQREVVEADLEVNYRVVYVEHAPDLSADLLL